MNKIEIYETSARGKKLANVTALRVMDGHEPSQVRISIDSDVTYQKITGIGGAFTNSSAFLLNKLSVEKREEIIEAYFGNSGARYSLARTHINSCDFSLTNYCYAPRANDILLEDFSIQPDYEELIPMIKDAMATSTHGFKIIASPWTAPPWMKDNGDWRGGSLLPKYYHTWALYFSKYISLYSDIGIKIWGLTVQNEPLGNDSNWESMHFTPEEMTHFVVNYLGPRLEQDGHDVVILGYDQNRGELKGWVDAQFNSTLGENYFDGTAVHWYGSTFDHFPEQLQYAHGVAPEKYLIQSEACIDAEIPRWYDDDWYWSKNATDWGWSWAADEEKHLHPKYVPVHRYAADIIGCLNNWVDGWLDWNLVLNRQGGPNWAENWCIAPVIVDIDEGHIYYTPLYYVISHFSRFIEPGAYRTEVQAKGDDDLMVTAVQNPNGTEVCIVFNPGNNPTSFHLESKSCDTTVLIDGQCLQTIITPKS